MHLTEPQSKILFALARLGAAATTAIANETKLPLNLVDQHLADLADLGFVLVGPLQESEDGCIVVLTTSARNLLRGMI